MTSVALLFVVLPVVAAAIQAREVSTRALRGPSSAANEVFRLEDRAMEQRRQGRPLAWADASADDVSDLDPNLAAPIIGVGACREYLKPLVGKVWAAGFVEERIGKGSHRKLVHPVTQKEVWVSMHTRKDVGRLARRILRDAGLE